MDHLVKFGFFHERPEFNFQALCPSPVECVTGSGFIFRSVFGSVLNTFFTAAKTVALLFKQLNYGVLRYFFKAQINAFMSNPDKESGIRVTIKPRKLIQ